VAPMGFRSSVNWECLSLGLASSRYVPRPCFRSWI